MPAAPDQYCHCTDCGPTPEVQVTPLFERTGDVNQATNRVLNSADDGLLFICEGNVTFTLPTAAADLTFSFFQTANEDVMIQDGNSGIMARNNDAAAQVSYATANQKVGAAFSVVAVQLSDTSWKWAFFAHCNHTLTVT